MTAETEDVGTSVRIETCVHRVSDKPLWEAQP